MSIGIQWRSLRLHIINYSMYSVAEAGIKPASETPHGGMVGSKWVNDEKREFTGEDSMGGEVTKRSPDANPEKKDMSRETMTAWICGTLVLLGLGGLYFGTRMDPMERDAECLLVCQTARFRQAQEKITERHE